MAEPHKGSLAIEATNPAQTLMVLKKSIFKKETPEKVTGCLTWQNRILHPNPPPEDPNKSTSDYRSQSSLNQLVP